MNSTNSYGSGKKFHHIIREDVKNLKLKKDIQYEYRNLSDFYLDSEKKSRLESMDSLHRLIYKTGWLLKSMFLHLTPLRRILVLAGVILLLKSRTVTFDDTSITTNEGLLGGILILFVLFLELKDKLLARHELEAGRKVQQAMMPERSPKLPGWEIWLFMRPANEVGGDLVDYLRLNENRAVITIADVAGKGLRAALLSSKLQATIRALASEIDSLSELGKRINKIFHRDSLPSLFASMLTLQIDSRSAEVNYINAGHFPPIILKDKVLKEFPRGDAALGIIESTEYNEHAFILEQNEVFIAYSDGILEAINERGEFFGTERFHQLLKNLDGKSPQQIGQFIISVLEQFIGNNPAADDMSLIIIKKEF